MTPKQITKIVTMQADSYHWKPNSRIKVDPDKAVAAFIGIYHRDGALTPQAVVKTAESPDSSLHDEFEWDDAEAARRDRENTAYRLIRSLEVVFKKPDGTRTQPIRAYHRIVPSADDPALDEDTERVLEPKVYIPVKRVMEEPDFRERIRRQAFRELSTWRQRYRDIDTFARIFEAIDALAEEFSPTG